MRPEGCCNGRTGLGDVLHAKKGATRHAAGASRVTIVATTWVGNPHKGDYVRRSRTHQHGRPSGGSCRTRSGRGVGPLDEASRLAVEAAAAREQVEKDKTAGLECKAKYERLQVLARPFLMRRGRNPENAMLDDLVDSLEDAHPKFRDALAACAAWEEALTSLMISNQMAVAADSTAALHQDSASGATVEFEQQSG